MTKEASTDDQETVAADQPKAWKPTLPPAHRMSAADARSEHAIVEQHEGKGMTHAAIRALKRPIVRLTIGVGLFVSAAIVVDSFVDMTSWTEREAKLRASKHARPLPAN
jgi:hypothetical protein